MTALVLRGMLERRLRSVLTAVAVVLGVAMIAGTYVQTDAISHAFGTIEDTAYKGVAATVTPRTAFRSQYAEPRPFSASLADRIRALPGVARAEGQLGEMGQLVVRGKSVNSTFAPSLVISSVRAPFNQVRAVHGRLPAAAGEVAIDTHTAASEGVSVGDTVGVAARMGMQRVRVVGTLSFGGGTSIGGATLIYAPLADVQRWYGARDHVTTVLVAAAPGVSPKHLVSEIRRLLPANLQVRTGQAQANMETREITDAIGGFLTPMLLALAGAALLVGAFIIFNTFSITVAQRTREFALLRSVGASRRQVLAAVAGEALVLGIGASAVGLACGLGFAKLLGALFDAAGFGIPRSGLILQTRTIVVALGVGIFVTLVAATVPALRATRIPPVVALQDAAARTGRGPRYAPYLAGLVSLMGVALLATGLFASGAAGNRLSTIGGGIVLVFIGLTLSARWFVRPLAALIGLPVARVFHEPGRIARENAMRNPARTAITSAALMVGLGLVVFVSVFAAGLKASVGRSLDRYVKADYIVASTKSQPLPAGAGPAIARVPGVAAYTTLLVNQIKVGSHGLNAATDTLDGLDAGSLRRVYAPDWVKGSDALFGELGGHNALIEQQFAKAHGLAVGDTFRVTTASGGTARLTAIGEYRDPQILQGVIVNRSTFSAVSSARDPYGWFVKLAPGANAASVHAALRAAVKPFPPAEVSSLAEYKQTLGKRLDQIVYLLYALLGMSLVISLFGIANSLFLSIHERTREFGLLRAIGATKRQIRCVVRYESVITAVIGGLLGMAVGIAFAALVTAALSDLGLGFSLPAVQLIIFLALAVAVGVLGAVAPARRTARLDPLDALRHE